MSSEPLDPPPPDAPDDSELEDFLAGRSAISAAYRNASGAERAPVALDAAILEAATATPARATRRLRWLPIVATAASLVLAVSLLINLRRETETRMTEPAPAVFTADKSFARASNAGAVRQAQEEARRRAEYDLMAREARGSRGKKKEAADFDVAGQALSREKAEPKPRSDRVLPLSPMAADRAPGLPQSLAGKSSSAHVPESAASPPPAPAQSTSSPGAPAPSMAAPSARSMPAPSIEATPLEVQPLAERKLRAMDAPLGADAWIERLRELRQRDQMETLREELRHFVETYPAYTLPSDLLVFAPRSGSADPKANPEGETDPGPPRE